MKSLLRLLGIVPFLVVSSVGCQQGGPASPPRPSIPDPVELPELSSGVHYQKTTLPSDGLLRYTLSVPSGYDPASPVPLVVALHYGGDVPPFYGGGMVDILVEPALGELGAIIVAPDALGGGDWTTSLNETAVVWLTRSILKSYAVDPRKVLVTGYSMGGQGTWFIAGQYPDLFTAAIPVSGEPVGDSLEWQTPAYVIHSRDDEIMPLGPTQKHVEQLKAQGAEVQLQIVGGLTHYQTAGFARPLREAVPWLKTVWNE